MGTQDLAPGKRLLHVRIGTAVDPLGDRPLRLGVLLSLHGPEPLNRGSRPLEMARGQALAVQAALNDRERVLGHPPSLDPPANDHSAQRLSLCPRQMWRPRSSWALISPPGYFVLCTLA